MEQTTRGSGWFTVDSSSGQEEAHSSAQVKATVWKQHFTQHWFALKDSFWEAKSLPMNLNMPKSICGESTFLQQNSRPYRNGRWKCDTTRRNVRLQNLRQRSESHRIRRWNPCVLRTAHGTRGRLNETTSNIRWVYISFLYMSMSSCFVLSC